MFVNCGIVAGPNSDFLIKKLITICSKLSKNKIKWYICEDIGYSKKLFPNSNNDFTELKKNENVTFIDPINSPKIKSGGDRHGLGVNNIINYLKNTEKLILLEPDSIPCCTGWDDVILSKLTINNPIVSMKYNGILDANFNITNLLKEKYRCPVVGNLIFMAINPKIFYGLNITFTKMLYNNNHNINHDLEKLGNARNFKVINNQLVKMFELPLNTQVQKETGWRMVHPLKENGYNSAGLKLYHYGAHENIKRPLDLIFNDNNNLLAIHLRYSRKFTNDKYEIYKKIIDKIINKYNISKELFDFL